MSEKIQLKTQEELSSLSTGEIFKRMINACLALGEIEESLSQDLPKSLRFELEESREQFHSDVEMYEREYVRRPLEEGV